MFVCLCNGVTDKQILRLKREQGIRDIKGLKRCTALGTQCGKCIPQAKSLLNNIEETAEYKEVC